VSTGGPGQPIQVQAAFDVADGRLTDVEPIRQQFLAQTVPGVVLSLAVTADEQGLDLTLTADSYDAFEQAVITLGPLFEQLDGPATLSNLAITGDLPDDMRAALAPFNPTFA
jgi:hypothetical protein